MSRGKRYDNERKLNKKKVFAVIVAFLVIIMFVVGIRELLKGDKKTNDKVFSTAYYTVFENNKWGVIDTKGNTVIEPKYENMIIIPDNSKPVFVVMEDIDYLTGTYKSKAVNEKNEQLFTNYDNVEVLYNNDENNNLWIEENILKVEKDGKYGLINLDGKELLKPSKDSINVISGTKSVYVTTSNGKKGIISSTGNVIIEDNYKNVTSLTNKYENGFIVENNQGEYGVINYDKSVALEEKYDEIKNVYGNSMYVVKESNTWKIVNSEKQEFLAGKFGDVTEINNENITIENNGKYGVVNLEGEEEIPLIYNSLKYAFSNYYIAKKADGTYGIVNLSNETALDFKYSYIKYISNAGILQAETQNTESELLDKNLTIKATGIVTEINQNKNYLRIRKDNDYVFYNFKLEQKANTEILSTNTIFLSKKNGKYGYVNDKGIVVVDYIYEDATEQNNYGYVAVKKDGKWGSLDSKGKVVQKCTYSLDNSTVIDFIGNWHLASDINANYYTK